MDMNFSYDYEELLDELKSDLFEGLISLKGKIKIVRGEAVVNNYRPIIDYYYEEKNPDEPYEELVVEKVIQEMEYRNAVIKTF